MAYSDNFGQIMLQGHQAREARRQAGEIAQLRYGDRGNNSNGGGAGGNNDELQWLKAGQELAKQEAQMRVLGEQQAEQIRQQTTKLMGEYAEAQKQADKDNKPLDVQAWLMQRGYLSQQIYPSDPRNWGQAFSEGTNGIINEQGHGVKYTIGGDHDDLVKNNAALHLINNGFNIDYGAEENTMTLGVDDDLTPKEKFQKFGEQAKNAFTPNSKTTRPLGESHGVTEGPNDATPSNTENQTKFEEGEYESAPEATHTFTLDQLDEAFKNRDFSSFPPEAQKLIRNYFANTFVGYDKQGQPTIFNIAETMDYLTAKQASDIKQQESAEEKLNTAFPALNNFDEQRSMFPGAADDINKEQQQYNDNIAAKQQAAKQRFDYALSLQPESQIAANNRQRREFEATRTAQANKFVENAKNPLQAMQGANVAAPNYDTNTGTGSGNSTYPHDPVQVANITTKASQPKEEISAKQQVMHAWEKDPSFISKFGDVIPPGTKNFDEVVQAVINTGDASRIQELSNYLANAVYEGKNIITNTNHKLTDTETKTLNALTNVSDFKNMLQDTGDSNVFKNFVDKLQSIAPSIFGNKKEDEIRRSLNVLAPFLFQGIGKNAGGATYTATDLTKALKTAGLNNEAFNTLCEAMATVAQNNALNVARNNNNNLVPAMAQLKAASEMSIARARLTLATKIMDNSNMSDEDKELVVYWSNGHAKTKENSKGEYYYIGDKGKLVRVSKNKIGEAVE